MPKSKEQPKQEQRRPIPPWLVAAVVAAVLLGVGLYGVRAGWFESEEDEFAYEFPPKGRDLSPRPVDTREDAVARAAFGIPEGAPVLGVGGAGGPSEATLTVREGRADVAIRVPRANQGGKPYLGYSIEVRSGERRLWGTRLPTTEADAAIEAVAISFNAELLRSIGAADAPLTVVVGGTAMRKGDALGIVQLTLPPTP
jgi:hypothetical protein